MIITLQLSAEEEHALRRTAEAAGADMDAVLHQLIALLTAPEALPGDAAGTETSAAKESAEQATDSPEEEAERRREQEEMQANIRRWHAERAADP